MAQPQIKFISPKEYLTTEESAEYKSEYFHGEIFAMSGATFHHNLITSNVLAGLHTSLRDSDCFVFGSDMKIQVAESLHYTYPDVSIVCGDIEFVENRDDTIINPMVIIEVLSRSTGDYDRGAKFRAYRMMPSLIDYIMIDQYSFHTEYFFKNKAGQWALEESDNRDYTFMIQSVGVPLTMETIYRRVNF